jgi:hypothetical protein
MIFTKKSLLEEMLKKELTGFIFPHNKKCFQRILKKHTVCFYNKRFSVDYEIKKLLYIEIEKNNINIYDNIELAKIAFSLGIDIRDRKEKQKIIAYVKEKYKLPFKGYYLRVK